MRKKIAKYYRREILKHGAEIVREEWIKESKRKKDWCFAVEVNYKGFNIFAPDDNELSSYKGAYNCVKLVDEELKEET